MSFFDELVGWVNDVLLPSEPLVNLQQLVHLLLETLSNGRMRKAEADQTLKSEKTDGAISQTPPEGVILLSAKTLFHSCVFHYGRKQVLHFFIDSKTHLSAQVV